MRRKSVVCHQLFRNFFGELRFEAAIDVYLR